MSAEKAAQIQKRFAEASKAVSKQKAATAPAKKGKRPEPFSFFEAKTAIQVHHAIRDLRNQSYVYGIKAAVMIPAVGACLWYGQYLLAIPFGIYGGWNWALSKDRWYRFTLRSNRPALAPDMMVLFDDAKPIPLEGAHNVVDFVRPPLKGLFKY